MPSIPQTVNQEPLPGLNRIRQGKVRDSYDVPDHPDKLLVVATDRISIFDFVLSAFVAQKGAILNAMNVFWRRKVMGEQFAHDLVACGAEIDPSLPEALRGNVDLQARASIVRKLDMLSMEAIARGCLTGTGLKAYQKDGIVCGHRLPADLADGDRLPCPLFTPSTKADVGHDEHITADSVAEKWGARPERLTLQLFALGQDYARKRGIILADTKFEIGRDPATGLLVIGDEVLSPDSSRYWDLLEWMAAQAKDPRKSPSGFDKQFVREEGKRVGIDKLDPANPDHVAQAHAWNVPSDVLARTTRLYRYIFWRLTGDKLETFQRGSMGMNVRPPKVRIEVLSGSESDVPQMKEGLAVLRSAMDGDHAVVRRHVISCHRNPDELRQYAADLADDAIVIAGAGMAAALPGILKAELTKLGKQNPVIGVAFSGTAGGDDLAARLSIERLPGTPVVLDPEGKAYFGPTGFTAACFAALEHEFLPPKAGASKPAKFDLPLTA